jgi:hypothetical protein
MSGGGDNRYLEIFKNGQRWVNARNLKLSGNAAPGNPMRRQSSYVVSIRKYLA